MARAHNGGKSTRKKEQAREGAVCRGAHIVCVAPPNIYEKEKSSFGVGATEACTNVSSRSRTRVGGGKEGPSMEDEGILEGVDAEGAAAWATVAMAEATVSAATACKESEMSMAEGAEAEGLVEGADGGGRGDLGGSVEEEAVSAVAAAAGEEDEATDMEEPRDERNEGADERRKWRGWGMKE